MQIIQDNAISPINASATSGGAAQVAPALPATAGKTNFIEGFDVTGGGATAASIIEISITGAAGGTMYFEMNILAGATGPCNAQGGLFIRFPEPIPATGANTAITVTVPSFGAGNTKSACTVYGFQK